VAHPCPVARRAPKPQWFIAGNNKAMERLPDTDFFICSLAQKDAPQYQLRWRSGKGGWQQGQDPYRFGPTVGDFDLHLFGQGKHEHLYRILGAHCCEHEGVAGVRFATGRPMPGGSVWSVISISGTGCAAHAHPGPQWRLGTVHPGTDRRNQI
jgi:1,4-alpha-glucan branching enzyme